MTEVMQETQRSLSVAEKEIASLLRFSKNTKAEDDRLFVLLDICRKEVDERKEEMYRRDQTLRDREACFGTMVTLHAAWAIEQCKSIPAGQYPKSRKLLARIIADGFLGTRSEKDRIVFALFLCDWPAEDRKIPADALREMAEFRWKNYSYKNEIRPAIEAFFLATYMGPMKQNTDVVRQFFKLVGNWAEITDVYALGQCFVVLHGRARQPLLDLIQNSINA